MLHIYQITTSCKDLTHHCHPTILTSRVDCGHCEDDTEIIHQWQLTCIPATTCTIAFPINAMTFICLLMHTPLCAEHYCNGSTHIQ